MKTVIVLTLLVAAGIVAVSIIDSPLFGPLDIRFLLWVNNAAHCQGLNGAMWVVSHIRVLHILLLIGIIILLFKKRYGQLIVFLLLFFFLQNITIAMKNAAGLPRPYEAMSGLWIAEGSSNWIRLEHPRKPWRMDSFPSGHTFTAFFFVGLFKSVRRMRWLFWAVALLIAFSRLYLGVHYLSDIVFGAMAGFALGSFVELLQFKSLLLEEER